MAQVEPCRTVDTGLDVMICCASPLNDSVLLFRVWRHLNEGGLTHGLALRSRQPPSLDIEAIQRWLTGSSGAVTTGPCTQHSSASPQPVTPHPGSCSGCGLRREGRVHGALQRSRQINFSAQGKIVKEQLCTENPVVADSGRSDMQASMSLGSEVRGYAWA